MVRSFTDVDTAELARRSVGLSGAEIAAVCREAAVIAMEVDPHVERLSQAHFLQAVAGFTPRITAEMLAFYLNYARTSGMPHV